MIVRPCFRPCFRPLLSPWQPNYSSSSNQYSSIPSGTLTYDTNGNLKSDGFHTYTWDADGNMSTLDTNALVYDAFDRRVEQTISGANQEIVYGPNGTKLALATGQSANEIFLPLPGGGTALYSTLGLFYRHPNWLGSNHLTSTSTSPSGSYYDGAHAPFGEPYFEVSEGSVDLNFTGQNQDMVHDLYDFQFREYHPTQGRWLSPDPAGLAAVDPTNPQSWNRYAYVLGNPLALTDVDGLYAYCGWWCQLKTFFTGGGQSGGGNDGGDEDYNPPTLAYSAGWQTGGGGGGGQQTNFQKPNPSPAQPANNVAQLPGILKVKISQVPQTCLAAFGTSRAALTRTASQIKFYNGATDTGNLYMFYKPSQYALPQYSFQNVNATTTANATTLFGPNGLPSPNVVVWGNFWDLNNLTAQAETLWHEATHVFTKQGDLQLDQRFNINTAPFGGPGFGASSAYNAWLVNGCH